jgi:hypothetical protein
MNDANLEHLLRTLKPAAPSAELTERVKHDLALADLFRDPADDVAPVSVKRSKPMTWSSAAFWAGIGAAAAVVVMMALPQGSRFSSNATQLAAALPKVAAGAGSLMPVSSTREWVDVEDQGIQFTTPDNPQRQMRVRSVERHQWIDPRDGAEYIVEVPQVESVALPVKFQ